MRRKNRDGGVPSFLILIPLLGAPTFSGHHLYNGLAARLELARLA